VAGVMLREAFDSFTVNGVAQPFEMRFLGSPTFPSATKGKP